MEKFVQNHQHSVFSQYDGVSTPEQLVEQAVTHGHQAVALTDHGVMGGLYSFQKAATKAGVKPLLGCEFYVVNDLVSKNDKGKRVRTRNNHIICIAKNETGWKSMLRLNYISNLDNDHFYYKPRFTFDEFFSHKDGLSVSSACLASPFSNLLRVGKEKEAGEMFERFCRELDGDFYAELQLNEIPEQKEYNSWLISQADKHGIPLIITGDVHYADKDGAATQEMMFRIRSDDENEVGQTFACRHLYYHGIDDYKAFSRAFGYGYTDEQIETWCSNACLIADKTSFLIPERTKMMLPRQAFDEDAELIKRAREGLCRHFGVSSFTECPKEYRDRLEFELRLMVKKGISRYFLTLMRALKWCDENKLSRGVGRGSCGGSLVAMCVDIIGKAIDPIKYGLLFERFISEARLVDCCIDYSASGQGNTFGFDEPDKTQ